MPAFGAATTRDDETIANHLDSGVPIWEGHRAMDDVADQLLAALHDGPFETPPWTTFLELLRAKLDADYSGIIFKPPDRGPGGVVELFAGDDAPLEVHQFYRESFYRSDPVMGGTLCEGQVYDLNDVFDETNDYHRKYRQQILEPRGVRHMKAVRVTEPSGVTGWMFIARRDKPFDQRDAELLARLSAHFRRSLRNHIALEGELLHARAADSIIARLNIGWLTLDATGTVVRTSAHASAILDHSAALKIGKDGRLVAMRSSANGVLQSAIAAISAEGSARPQAICVSDDPWLNMMLTPFTGVPASPDRTSVMIAFLQGETRFGARRHEQIAELFGLLPSEARLALLISQGASLAEAADKLAITLETARSYSKRIYAKMGVRGQADLVRSILTSVLTLA
jgi:DNA-binding CsgD family transcriptional regulator